MKGRAKIEPTQINEASYTGLVYYCVVHPYHEFVEYALLVDSIFTDQTLVGWKGRKRLSLLRQRGTTDLCIVVHSDHGFIVCFWLVAFRHMSDVCDRVGKN